MSWCENNSQSTYFDDLPDPRLDRTKQHLLKDILVITIYDREKGLKNLHYDANSQVLLLSMIEMLLP